jgi:hypothetical protein
VDEIAGVSGGTGTIGPSGGRESGPIRSGGG